MSVTFQYILALSCAIPATIASLKFKRAGCNYHPFFILLFLAVITELVANIPSIFYENYEFMRIAYPLYNIAELVLMLGFIQRNNVSISNWFIITAGSAGFISFAVTNICHNFYGRDIRLWNYTFIAFLAILLIQSIRLLSNQVFVINLKPFKNPLMLIAFGCVLYYSYFLLVSMFTNINTSIKIYGTIFSVHQIINALTYLIFTWAIIWIPRKAKY